MPAARGLPARQHRSETAWFPSEEREEGGGRKGREDQSLGRLRGAGSRQTSRWGAEKQQKLPSPSFLPEPQNPLASADARVLGKEKESSTC